MSINPMGYLHCTRITFRAKPALQFTSNCLFYRPISILLIFLDRVSVSTSIGSNSSSWEKVVIETVNIIYFRIVSVVHTNFEVFVLLSDFDTINFSR